MSLDASSSASGEGAPLVTEGAVLLMVFLMPAFVSALVVSGRTAEGDIAR